METVSFCKMEDGTREDYEMIDRHERDYARGLPDKVIAALNSLQAGQGGFKISRLEHSLQSATRAMRDGADEEMILAALVHDIGDELAPYNHSELAAALIRPYVRPEITWIVEQHGLFQNYYYVHHLGGNRNARDRFRDHPWFQACADFCAKWDQTSFSPDYASEPLETFEPLIRDIFTRRAHDPRYIREI